MVRIGLNELESTLTEEELKELDEAEKRPIVFDEDSTEMTEEMLQEFKRANREARNKQTVSLRLSPSTLKKAKAYGKGYTAFLSRLIEAAINDEELVRKCI